ncbi:CaiB/BaiF CoA transferase family protein [Piscinibacter sp.]|uniref:CaiB/BaiF CoA transferase family protein n=1 Tax=Piscinibacter sp. TaxID=1903157 RepID=UPI0035AED25A
MSGGPLKGYRIVEFAGLGPGPFAGMMLADLGADVILIDRPDAERAGDPRLEFMHRGKRSIVLDLKQPGDRQKAAKIVDSADALIEGLRPGVMERLGLGPSGCLARNGKLVYGRMTGWGQTGTLAARAGHDINYLALSGALHAIGTSDGGPVVPLNLVGDFGGGGMLLAFGIVAALLHAKAAGEGQVVDASVLDGSAALMAQVYSRHAMGRWVDQRESNMLDGGAPYYRT